MAVILSALIPLGLIAGSWVEIADPTDLLDPSGDIRSVNAYVKGDSLYLTMTVQGIAAPAIEQTAEGLKNRYYYHWLLDTDNNPATGRSNSEYESKPTGLKKPLGSERVVMIGWRDGKPNGVKVYDPLKEDVTIKADFTFQASGNTLSASIPLADLGLSAGQTLAVSAFQEGASDGWAVDWIESQTLTLTGPTFPVAAVDDPKDMADSSGDILGIRAHVEGSNLLLSMTFQGIAAPSISQTAESMQNRYYYHWLLDTDNNPATGRSNSEYESKPTGLKKPLGSERVVMIGWRDGKPNGVKVYDPLKEDVTIKADFTFQASGNTLTALIPLAELGLSVGQTIAVSAFQEGASDGWAVDWIESQTLALQAATSNRMKLDGQFEDWAAASVTGSVFGVNDVQDMADSSGDLKRIEATVDAGYLYLRMAVQGIALPSVEQTPEGMKNRYYYHWLVDTDNNPATGRSNSEYESKPTGLKKPLGSELVVMIGWKDGKPNGINVYDPLKEDVTITTNITFSASGDSVEAKILLADLKLALGQTIAVSAFQEGASDGWAVDWVESTVMTLSESSERGMTLNSVFSGDAYGFSFKVEDSATEQVDITSVAVRVDGQSVEATTTKTGAITTIIGRHASLLAANTKHTVSLSLKASGKGQLKSEVYTVEPYGVALTANSLKVVDNNPGFVVRVAQISSLQSGMTSVHSNIVDLAEKQLAGLLKDETTGAAFLNEAEPNESKWTVKSENLTKTINWWELAPEPSPSLNFPNDDNLPKLSPQGAEGVVVEILTYLLLEPGSHKIGLYTEGGHKVSAGLTPTAPALSFFDNSVTSDNVPSYFGRNQFFNLVVTEVGYYPLRVLWFQSKRNQELGLMLELFSVKDRELHLLNDTTNPKSIRTYRAGSLLGSSTGTPTITLSRQGSDVLVQWTGMLQVAENLTGPWRDYADAQQSPLILPVTDATRFARARSY